jgi:anti-sigma B factor antagonist
MTDMEEVRSMTCTRHTQLRLGRNELAHGRTVVVPIGEIDLATRDLLRSALEASHGDVIVDLSGVSYLESVGIGVLVAQRNRLTLNGGSLQLRDPQPFVRQVLEIVGLETWIA